MSMVAAPAKSEGRLTGAATAAAYLINNNTDNTLFTFRYRLKGRENVGAEEAFSEGGQNFNAGTFIIKTDGASAPICDATRMLRRGSGAESGRGVGSAQGRDARYSRRRGSLWSTPGPIRRTKAGIASRSTNCTFPTTTFPIRN